MRVGVSAIIIYFSAIVNGHCDISLSEFETTVDKIKTLGCLIIDRSPSWGEITFLCNKKIPESYYQVKDPEKVLRYVINNKIKNTSIIIKISKKDSANNYVLADFEIGKSVCYLNPPQLKYKPIHGEDDKNAIRLLKKDIINEVKWKKCMIEKSSKYIFPIKSDSILKYYNIKFGEINFDSIALDGIRNLDFDRQNVILNYCWNEVIVSLDATKGNEIAADIASEVFKLFDVNALALEYKISYEIDYRRCAEVNPEFKNEKSYLGVWKHPWVINGKIEIWKDLKKRYWVEGDGIKLEELFESFYNEKMVLQTKLYNKYVTGTYIISENGVLVVIDGDVNENDSRIRFKATEKLSLNDLKNNKGD